jgi:hypothetical protein
MSETKIGPLKPDKYGYEPLNIEVAKGIFVDGIGIGVTDYYIVLDGLLGPPRSKKEFIVSRLILPIEALKELHQGLTSALKDYEEQIKKTPKSK